MNIDKYIAHIERCLSTTAIVTSYTLNIDRKTQEIVFLSGKIDCRDGSVMDFKEFIEEAEAGIVTYKYGYNYRKDDNVLFRYDNAPDPRARTLASFPHHKHTQDGEIVESWHISLDEVLEEIEDSILDSWNG
ncbi:MAG: hypothetical protein GY801_21510 [bacterium]|nr:hypothetical protein [bacterium]